MPQKAKAEDREVRGPADHGFVRSIYFSDPNGYVIELTASTGQHGEIGWALAAAQIFEDRRAKERVLAKRHDFPSYQVILRRPDECEWEQAAAHREAVLSRNAQVPRTGHLHRF